MKHFTETIELTTTESLQFIDITDRVRDVFAKSNIERGVVTVFTTHTTTAIRVNERCEHLQRDMADHLQCFAPRAKQYHHDEIAADGRANAHSHLISLMMGSSESIPIVDGNLKLGGWQSVFFVELDGPREKRMATITVMGV